MMSLAAGSALRAAGLYDELVMPSWDEYRAKVCCGVFELPQFGDYLSLPLFRWIVFLTENIHLFFVIFCAKGH
jgi:hypothetical protein